MIVHSGRFGREDRAADRWPRLPFDVPAGCAGVTVELSYDRGDGAVLDLGCEGAAGWRGWSGGARDSYAITPAEATPGYLPGPLEPGEWHVVLGLHRVPRDGVAYRVRVTLGPAVVPPSAPAPALSERPPPRALPAEPGLRWVACDFHAHTEHSDGVLTVAQLAARAASRGLDVLAVTDHNTTGHFASLAASSATYGVHLLPGQEVTTDIGHANAFGELPWIDFRRPADSWRDTVDAAGGLLSVNHPLAADFGWLHPLRAAPALAEVWHWSWLDRRWTGPLAWWRAAGMGVVPVGGSDFHAPGEGTELGVPLTWVAVRAVSTEGVLDGLRAGRTAVSADRDGPVLLRLGGSDGEFVALGADGALLLGPDGERRPVRSDRATLPAVPGGHVLIDPDGTVLALSA